jgi:hypothetical protein
MDEEGRRKARDRVLELAADGRYRPFVVGYLLSCLSERHWDALVQAALEFGEAAKARQEAAESRSREVRANGG